MIQQEIIDKLLDAADIVEVIGETVKLEKKGINYMGCCPFHNDKSPSFSVSPSRRIYKCFSCGEAGNVISYLTKNEGLTFIEACKYLGQKYNIAIPEEKVSDEDAEKAKHKESVRIVLQAAMEWFQSRLRSSVEATKFLAKRKVKDEVCSDYIAGYAPKGWSELYDYLRDRGFDTQYMLDADLIRKNSRGGYIDTFRDRIMFPFLDSHKRVVGFTGRTISGDDVKYLNTGETLLFNKGSQIFGLQQARNEIVRQDQIIMCEGQFDVLSMHQAGITNVVCGSSTALSEAQRKILMRFSHNILLLYDGDKAGRNGAVKHIPELLADGFNVTVAILPDNQDPDEFCHSRNDVPVWISNNKKTFVNFLLAELYDCKTDLAERSKALEYIYRCISLCTDKLIRHEAVKIVNQHTDTPQEEVVAEIKARRKDIAKPGDNIDGFIGIDEAMAVEIAEEDENIITLTDNWEVFSENLSINRYVYYHGEITESDCQRLRTLSNTILVEGAAFKINLNTENYVVSMLGMLFKMGFTIQIADDETYVSFIDWYVGNYGNVITNEGPSSDVIDIYVERCADMISFAGEATRTRSMDNWAKALKMKGAQLKAIVKPFVAKRKDKKKAERDKLEVDAEILEIETETIPAYVEDSEEFSRMYKRFGFYPLLNKKGTPVSYMFKTDNGSHTRVSDFYMEPLLHIKSKDKEENKRVLKLNHLYFNRSVYVEWKSSIFSSMATFKDMLVNEGCFNFEGGDIKKYERIWQYMSYTFQQCTELKVFGQQQEDFFAFSNAIIHQTDGEWKVEKTNNLGIVEHNGENYYSPAFSEIYAGERRDNDKYAQDRWLVYTDTPKAKQVTFEKWASLMDRVYKINDNGKWAIIYAILCAFRSDIWPINRLFTSVFLIGSTQSGKTQIAISIRSLFIKPEAPSFNLNSGTDAAFFSVLERFRDVPQVMEEYNDEMISDAKFQGLKSVTYDGEGKQKRKSATSNDIDTSQVNAPVILLGQEAPQKDDNALTNRVVILEVPKHDYINDIEAQTIFNELKNIEKDGLSYLLFEVLKMRSTVRENFPSIQKSCARELMDRVRGSLKSGEQTRIINTVSLFLAMVKLMEQYAPHLKLPFTYGEFVRLAEEKVNTQVDMIARTDKLAQFFDTIDGLIDTGSIKIGRDYKIDTPRKITLKGGAEYTVPADTKILFMNIRNIHSMYARAKVGDKALTLTTLEVNLKSHPAYIGMVSNTRFKWWEEKVVPRGGFETSDDRTYVSNEVKRVVEPFEKQTSAAVFDYGVLKKYLELDFEREKPSVPVRTIGSTDEDMPFKPLPEQKDMFESKLL